MDVKKKFSLCVPFMDQEHEVIYKEAVVLMEALHEGQLDPAFIERVENLEQTILDHFNHEELLLRNKNYPNLDAHIAKHHELLHKFQNIKHILVYDGVTAQQVKRIKGTIERWINVHLEEEDREVVLWLKTQGKM